MPDWRVLSARSLKWPHYLNKRCLSLIEAFYFRVVWFLTHGRARGCRRDIYVQNSQNIRNAMSWIEILRDLVDYHTQELYCLIRDGLLDMYPELPPNYEYHLQYMYNICYLLLPFDVTYPADNIVGV